MHIHRTPNYMILMKSLSINFSVDTSKADCMQRYLPHSFMADAQEIAHHHATAIGFGYKDLISTNSAWVLSRMKVRYLRAPKWNEQVTLTTWHKGRDGIFSLRDFEICNGETGEVLIKATSSWLIIDLSTRRMLRTDHTLGERGINTTLQKDAIAEHCQRISVPKEPSAQFCRNVKVLYSDIDMNRHTNNARYMMWALDSIPAETLQNNEIDEFQINFNMESKLNDTITINTCPTSPETYYIEGVSVDGKNIFQTNIKFKK